MQCVACSKGLPETAKFCRYCGANQSQAAAPAQPPPASTAASPADAATPARSKATSTLAIAVVAVLVVVAAGGWFWNSKQQSDAKIAELQKKAEEEANARKYAEADAAAAKNAANVDTTATVDLQQPTPLIKPSFDCAKAATAVEKMICDSPKISMLDSLLAHAYSTAQANEKDIAKKEQNKSEQLNWLKATRNTCKDVNCLEEAYAERVRDAADPEVLNKYLVSAGWQEKQYVQGQRFCDQTYQKNDLRLVLHVYCAGGALESLFVKVPASAATPATPPPTQAQTLGYSHGTYVGEVANGKANGQGKYTSNKTGTTYTGSFVDDKFNGGGTMTWTDGSKFVGNWQSDVGVQGEITLLDGRVLKGTVKNAKFTESR